MTARQVYEGVLIEMNKVNAPSLLLEDFNYLFNKAIYQYINKKYNVYDTNQQSTDDVRVLKATAILDALRGGLGQSDLYNRLGGTRSNSYDEQGNPINSGEYTTADVPYDRVAALGALHGATYDVNLPDDYLHLLNCICVYKVKKPFKCYNPGTYVQFAATRLTADAWANVINNFYMRPSYKKPYYYIHNVNTSYDVPTNPYDGTKPVIGNAVNSTESEDDGRWDYIVLTGGGTSYTINASNLTIENNVVKVNGSAITADNLQTILATKPGTLYYDNTDSSAFSLKTAPDGITDPTQYSVEYKKTVNANTGGSAGANANGTDANGMYHITNYLGNGDDQVSNFPRQFNLGSNLRGSLVEKPATHRYGNTSKVRMEIRYGKDTSLFELVQVYVDYIKVPQFIRLTQEEIDLTEDTSQMMEFPDYVCQEIINELTKLLMENSSDQRLQSNIAVNLTIGLPAQQLAPQQ